MRKVPLALSGVIALVAASEAANVQLSNFDSALTKARPISLQNGTLLPANSGSISIGTFNTLSDTQITVLGGAGRDALLADFIAFANSVSNPIRIGDANAFNFQGLYDGSLNEAITAGDSRIGKSIYTFIGNGNTLANSDQIAIVKDSDLFVVDAPLATAQAYIHELASSTLLIGTVGPLTTVPGVGIFPTLQLVGAAGQSMTAFVYQGRLNGGGSPVTGLYDFSFRLFNAPEGGAQVGRTFSTNGLSATSGLFTVLLDFGPGVFDGSGRWLDIAVKSNGLAVPPTTLIPRQPITPAPMAQFAPGTAGPAGPQGPKGDTGLNGPPGPQGLTGATGPAGPPGPKGDKGDAGAIGAQGPVGPTGATGLQGPAGAAGATGPAGPEGLKWRSAWSAGTSYAMDDAISHNGSSWMAKLANTGSAPVEGSGNWDLLARKGDTGATGAAGAQGPQGPAGAIGATGAQGPQGPAGAAGATGPPGSVGPQGPPGSADAWSRTGNAGTSPGVNFLGTTDNQPLELKVSNQRVLRLEPNATSPNSIGGWGGNVVNSGAFGASISGGGALTHLGGSASNVVSDHFGVIGGGAHNLAGNPNADLTDGWFATVGGGHFNVARGGAATVGGGANNEATGGNSTVAGGYLNIASGNQAAVGGGSDNRAIAEASTVGGGLSNHARDVGATVSGGRNNTALFQGDTVGGGEQNTARGYAEGFPRGWATVNGGFRNLASAEYATVSGGRENTSSGESATVGGGWDNTASGESATVSGGSDNAAWGEGATVSGGFGNLASEGRATVGGGSANIASQVSATVSGGTGNTANGIFATVPGGGENTASGFSSFAAGFHAKATHDGAFVWADSNPFNYGSTGPNTARFRATSGFGLTTGIDGSGNQTAGLYVPGGGSAWVVGSDRNAKTRVESVDPRQILERVVDLPVATWSYKAQTNGVRHIGPMAQDFFAAFALGDDEKGIATVDADGVALAAIQGLNQKLEEQRVENAVLRRRLEKLEQLMNAQGGGAK